MATLHDPSEGFQLTSAEGWKNVLAILNASGERPPKRPSHPDDNGQSERLAKRIGGVRLD